MNDLIYPLELNDNVGDSLGKINYNFLNINASLCNLKTNYKGDVDKLKKLEKLMDRLDAVIGQMDYDDLQKMYTTVNLLSSYWDKTEFSVQYPFNSFNGYTSLLAGAGELGQMYGSTDAKTQEKLLSDALVESEFYKNSAEAIGAIYNKQIIYVIRNSDGQFQSWDYMNATNIFAFNIDDNNNFYYNGYLVDLYTIPFYSAIAPAGIDIYKKITVDFFDKSIFSDQPIKQNKQSIEANALIIYSDIVEKELDPNKETLDVTKYKPNVQNLKNIIPAVNKVYASKLLKFNDTVLESYTQNLKVHNLSLDFLNKNYKASKYLDGVVVNVVFFLYSAIGSNLISANVQTKYWDALNLTEEKNKVETINKSAITKEAPTSNSTLITTFNKKSIYIQKIVLAKYVKKSRLIFKSKNINGIIKQVSEIEHYWHFLKINIGNSFNPEVVNIKKVPKALIYKESNATSQEVKQFPTPINTEDFNELTTTTGNTFLIQQ
jgi:hypothetical protein